MRAALVLAAALGVSLLLARVHPFGDAGLFAAGRGTAPQLPASIPTDVRAVLVAKCADCHSTPARAPFYGHFAPVSWLLERDIVEARRHMDLSAWETYTPERQQALLAEMALETRRRAMPPLQYRLAHWNAGVTAADAAAVSAWEHAVVGANAAAAGDPSPANDPGAVLQGDATRGGDLFERRCTGCHSLTENKEGPRLGGVYGRPSATIAGFPYSTALGGAHLTWNEATLDRWLTDPDAFVPNNNMDFRVPKPQERADIVAYLKQTKGE